MGMRGGGTFLTGLNPGCRPLFRFLVLSGPGVVGGVEVGVLLWSTPTPKGIPANGEEVTGAGGGGRGDA